jgi:hypothetical protein
MHKRNRPRRIYWKRGTQMKPKILLRALTILTVSAALTSTPEVCFAQRGGHGGGGGFHGGGFGGFAGGVHGGRGFGNFHGSSGFAHYHGGFGALMVIEATAVTRSTSESILVSASDPIWGHTHIGMDTVRGGVLPLTIRTVRTIIPTRSIPAIVQTVATLLITAMTTFPRVHPTQTVTTPRRSPRVHRYPRHPLIRTQ